MSTPANSINPYIDLCGQLTKVEAEHYQGRDHSAKAKAKAKAEDKG